MANPLMQMMMGQGMPQMNPMIQLMMAVKSGNPNQALQLITNQNPQIRETLSLLQGRTPQDMENICRNLCQKKGMDFDGMLNQVKNMMR